MDDAPLALVREALVGRYLVGSEIGRGGMAKVYRAIDSSGRDVAVKVMDPAIARLLGAGRFRREIEILGRLQHPGIVPLLDAGEAGELLYYVMPFVEGETLRARLRRERQLPLEEALALTGSVLDALAYAHQQNVVHRDIKPENILLEKGRPRVADFGIARAIVRSGDSTVSTTGFAIGTPEYMSPEQAAADPGLDARSDLYSTACVLYEMLAGTPPFSGRSPQSIQARHAHEAPPPLLVVRPRLPPGLVAVVERGLAKVPAERFQTAEEFREELERGVVGGRVLPRARGLRRQSAVVAIVLAVAVMLTIWLRQSSPADTRYVILPFRHAGGSVSELMGGEKCAQLLFEAIERWKDVQVVDPLRLASVVERSGQPDGLRKAFELAREVGAGRLLWGEVVEQGDSILVRAYLYRIGADLVDPDQRSELVVRRPESDPTRARELVAGFARLVRELLFPTLALAETPPDLLGTSYTAALAARLSGDSARLSWDIAQAEDRYREALRIDPSYAQARLSLAQLGQWTDEPAQEWLGVLAPLLADSARLSIRQREELTALQALGEERYGDACAIYETLTKHRAQDFAAWLGYGDCTARDRRVLRDRASRTGWRFASSYETAARAYMKAFIAVPSSHRAFAEIAATRLLTVLPTSAAQMRMGFAVAPDSGWFGAWPQLVGDTCLYLPQPLQALGSLLAERAAAGRRAALARNRAQLARVIGSWLAAYPNSPRAWQARAAVLEVQGELDGSDSSALSALGRAFQTSVPADTVLRFEIRLALVRIRLKLQQWQAARGTVDSLLTGRIPPPASMRARLAPLAALVGQPDLAIRLLLLPGSPFEVAGPDGTALTVPAALRAAAASLYVYGAIGMPGPSFMRAEQECEKLLQSAIPPSESAAATVAVLELPSVLAFPVHGARAVHQLDTGWYLLDAQRAVAGGDLGEAGRLLTQVDTNPVRRLASLAEQAPEILLQEAYLRVAIGDTLSAARTLAGYFSGLSSSSRTDVLATVQSAAGIPRALALRASLARFMGDTVVLGVASAALAELWGGADARLSPVRISTESRLK